MGNSFAVAARKAFQGLEVVRQHLTQPQLPKRTQTQAGASGETDLFQRSKAASGPELNPLPFPIEMPETLQRVSEVMGAFGQFDTILEPAITEDIEAYEESIGDEDFIPEPDAEFGYYQDPEYDFQEDGVVVVTFQSLDGDADHLPDLVFTVDTENQTVSLVYQRDDDTAARAGPISYEGEFTLDVIGELFEAPQVELTPEEMKQQAGA